jgi:tetratricopeptide (TPR) repeat protein
MLADIYYQKKLYKYAAKICKLGLKQDPNNLEGLYVLAKTFLIQGKTEQAEQTLKKILRMCPFHLHSSLLMLHVLEDLNRNKKAMAAYTKTTHSFYPSNLKVQAYYRKYCNIAKNKNPKNKKKGASTPIVFNYNPKLATITMYKLLCAQKKYRDAFSLLKILAKNPKYKKFVEEESKTIKVKLNRG